MKTVLAIDSQRHILRLIEVNLERQGYRVLTATDAAKAIWTAQIDPPDAIILDGLDVSLIRALDADAATKDVRRIYMPSAPPRWMWKD